MRIRSRILPAALGLLALAALAPGAFAAVEITSNTFGGLSARAIGPATMSGRIAALAAVGEDPLTIYVGAASGGVWKSTDGGVTFRAIFDEHPQSIGAIAIDPSNHDVVWVGTGEPWTRNSTSVGKGVFKTTDGGRNWQEVGLVDSERISTIRIDPQNGDTVYVCATGHLWNANEERGLFKTTDGGESWEKILYVDADTGCADIDLDPQDPRILYAAMWQFRRQPDFFTSGGPGSGLHKTTDGGATWKELTAGLPEGEKGRIAVAVAPSRPSVVYATVEAEKTALYRSDDVGESWREVNSSTNVVMRPFYFGELVVDPSDFQRVYKPGFTTTVSVDGGESFTSMFSGNFSFGVHPDHHALWINPHNPHEVLLGTDGGLYISHDRANHWRFAATLPISQFYRVSHDLEWPYNVYGGLQDNGSWTGPSRSPGGIQNRDWDNIGFGDGFWSFADPQDANTLYVEYQGGRIFRVDRRLTTAKSIVPYPNADQEDFRFNWNTPIHLSPSQPGTLYFGAQYLLRSQDRGESWEAISPDLTTDDPQKQRQAESGGLSIDNSTAENHCTIYAISESPRDAQVIWAGTDDGNLQVTRDGGGTWTNVAGNAPGLPAGTWVSMITASPFDAGTAFATFDGHRTGDMTTYVYRTTDYGASWQSLATENIEGYAQVVRQDLVNADLLFLGTEFGLYITLDGGQQWARFTDMPRVSVRDIAIHPSEHDVIVGTHGRGVYIIDDITALRSLTQEILDANVHLLPSRPAPMVIAASLQTFGADDQFVGPNPPETASINYYLKKRHLFGDLKVEVYGQDGELLATLPGRKRPGLNRVEWPMRLKPPKVPPATNLVPVFQGPRVPEGTYTVKLIKGKETLEGTVELVADPRNPHPAADRALQQKTALELYARQADLTYLIDSMIDLRDQARARADGLGEKDRLASGLRTFADGLETRRGGLVSTSEAGMISGDEKLREHLGTLFGNVVGYDGRPTDSQLARSQTLSAELKAAEEDLARYLDAELDKLNNALGRKNLEPLSRLDRAAWEAEDEGGAATSAAAIKLFRARLPLRTFGALQAF